MLERKHSKTHSKSNTLERQYNKTIGFSPPVGVGLLDFKKKSTPSSSLLLVNQHANTDANKDVNRNVKKMSIKVSIRMSIEMSIKMSIEMSKM